MSTCVPVCVIRAYVSIFFKVFVCMCAYVYVCKSTCMSLMCMFNFIKTYLA